MRKIITIDKAALSLFLFCLMGGSSCGQEKPKQMVEGSSHLNVVAESLGENEDGVAEIIFGGISPPFKPTEYTHLGARGLKDAPPLPTGFRLFKDSVFQVKTQAMVSGSYLTVFRIASANDEAEFGKLHVLHLKYDVLSPTNFSWDDATVYPGGWQQGIHYIARRLYDERVPDFKTKRIAGITDQFGIFAIALPPESEVEGLGPFPKVTLKATSTPEPVQAGEAVTHTITLTNEGTSDAAEVNLKAVLRLDYVSAGSTQGVCKQKEALNIVVCHLGRLRAKTSATVTIAARYRPEWLTQDRKTEVTSLEAVFKQVSTDFVDERGQIFSELTTTIVKKKL